MKGRVSLQQEIISLEKQIETINISSFLSEELRHLPPMENIGTTESVVLENREVSDKLCSFREGGRPRILILCDEHGRHLYNYLNRQYSQGQYDIEMIIKPGAHFHGVLQYLSKLTEDFNGQDFVIVSGGYNDLINNKFPQMKTIWKLLKPCLYTNFIFLECPTMFKTNSFIAHKIKTFNSKFRLFINRIDRFCETSLETVGISNDRGFCVRKWQIGRLVKGSIVTSLNKTKSLTFVKTTELIINPTKGQDHTSNDVELVNASTSQNLESLTYVEKTLSSGTIVTLLEPVRRLASNDLEKSLSNRDIQGKNDTQENSFLELPLIRENLV